MGTVHILYSEAISGRRDTIVLNLKAGQIPVTFGPDEKDETTYWMLHKAPEFGRRFSADRLASVLGLASGDIDDRFPIEEVSTALPHILVPLTNLESLKRAGIIQDNYFSLIRETWTKPVLIFCPESHRLRNHISVRMFDDCFGIPEDPVTGSGYGCLSGHLVCHRYFGGTGIDIRCKRGYEIGRPSLLFLKAEEKRNEIVIRVGGKAGTVAKGKFV